MFRPIRLSILLLVGVAAMGCAARVPAREQQISELAVSLNDPDPSVQVQTLLKLTEFGRDARATTPVLLQLLRGNDRNVRKYAALAVTRVAKAEDAVPALMEALNDSDADVRRQAAMGLGELGPAAKAALPALEKFREEPDRCAIAATAIRNVGK
ncbi:hypothetical protein AYO40_04195 [Planctomycetaceae bacterium SCGC AG-212-D15]|nr:hypothetical protein AYO40_04195 [Planctomycetaceae bacterium SCGC AG-212-D15]